MLKIIIGFFISYGAVVLCMPYLIQYLKKISFNQTVSEYSLQAYKEKAQTPIMGGILFIVVPVIVTILLCGKDSLHIDVLITLLTFVGYGLIGFTDDYLIAVKKDNDGLKPRDKFICQIIFAGIVYLLYRSQMSLSVSLPLTKKVFSLGPLYSVLILLMFSGASNAVNLTDGMDGLAAGCTLIALIPFLLFSITQNQLSIGIFIGTLIGALLGYLKFNMKPAKIFMGDTGSLSLGAVLAVIAMVLKKELLLVVIGGVFVLETLCVMIQIGSVKLRGKRVFLYTPIHYSFVMKGMDEKQVVLRFWAVSILFAILGYFLGR